MGQFSQVSFPHYIMKAIGCRIEGGGWEVTAGGKESGGVISAALRLGGT